MSYKEIKEINVVSFSNILGIVSSVLSTIFFILLWIVSFIYLKNVQPEISSQISIVNLIVSIPLIIIFQYITGFIIGLITSYTYNLITKYTNMSIKIKLK